MKVKTVTVKKELVVIGGGIPGIVAALQAARLGVDVALINDRGYLGGNASAEIRVSVSGADGSQDYNFYAREGGIMEELRLENLYRNPKHNWYIWDALLRDFVDREETLDVYLETHIDEAETAEDGKIRYVSGTQKGSETRFKFCGDFFLDDTGHGTVGYLAGADYRMGREGKDEFGERIAPDESDEYVIPSTLTWYAKDVGEPVEYIAPSFALRITETDVLKYRQIPTDSFNRFRWYYELGGDRNQITESREIIRDHQALVYGIWDYIKNSGKYDARTFELEYVACIPGWRESRRLMGDYILTEKDVAKQREFADVVGHGGWSIDLHAIKGFFSSEPMNHHVFLKGIYQIPYRTGYSRNVNNLFMAGRCMSTTHVAFGTTRVIATLTTLGQALGVATYLCEKYRETPRGIHENHIDELQQILLKEDHYVVGIPNRDPEDKARKAKIEVSSVRKCELVERDSDHQLSNDTALILPVKEEIDTVSLFVRNPQNTVLKYNVYTQDKKFSYYPEKCLESGEVKLESSSSYRWMDLPVGEKISKNKIFLEIKANDGVSLGTTTDSLVGVISIQKAKNSNPRIVDIDTLKPREYIWRKLNQSICFKTSPEQNVYGASNINNGYRRPFGLPNVWISQPSDKVEWIEVNFSKKERIHELRLYFDSDFNRSLRNFRRERVRVIPTLVKDYSVYYHNGEEFVKLKEVRGNHLRMNKIEFEEIETDCVRIEFWTANGSSTNVFEVRAY